MIPQEKLKRDIASKYGISLGEMNEMILSQDLFLSEVIKNKADRKNLKFPSIRLPGFGIFFVPEKKIKKFREIREDPNINFE